MMAAFRVLLRQACGCAALFLRYSVGGALHKLPEHLGIIARAAEPDAARDLRDGLIGAAKERETLLDAVMQEEVKRRLVHGRLKQTTEFALARVAGRGHLVERDRLAFLSMTISRFIHDLLLIRTSL